MKSRSFSFSVVGLLLIATVGCAVQQVNTSQPYYKGKTITLIDPFSPGGSTYIRGQFTAEHLPKFLPGQPRILVENRPGGGGALAFNYVFDQAKPDGLTVGLSTEGVLIRWLTREQGHTYNLNDMKLIASVSNVGILYARSRPGAASMEELIALKQPVKSGHTTPSSSFAVFERMVAELFGMEIKVVPGYKSYGETTLAVLRGEVDLSWGGTETYVTSLQQHVASGAIVPLFQTGMIKGGKVVRDPRIPDLPTMNEVYQAVHNKSAEQQASWPAIQATIAVRASGVSFWLPKGTPQERVAEWTQAMTAMTASADYQEAVKKTFGTEELTLIGPDAQDAFNTFANTPQSIVDQLK